MRITIAILFAVLSAICANAQVNPHRVMFEKLHAEPGPEDEVPQLRNNIQMKYIEQRLDHFNAQDTRTWQMRYLSNDYHFKENGPIFVYVGGEWTISEGSLRSGHMFDMAKSLNGYMFYTEHRFYGRSQPMSKLTRESLDYLNVKQALADLKHFIEIIKNTTPGLQNAKVIIVGGSYSATMVAWFRRLYPLVAQGAWASSAPLLAKVDFWEYKEVMGKSIETASGIECYQRIERATKTLEEQILSGRLSEVTEYINMCPNFDHTNERDVSSFFYLISEIFASLVQSRTVAAIRNACNTILAAEDDSKGLGAFIKSEISSSRCIDFSYEAEIAELKDENPLAGAMRQWYFQTCNEFAWFQTSTSKDQPFGSTYPVDHFYHVCQDVYGNKFNSANIEDNIRSTNEYFGDLQPAVTNVYFTHGTLDPWSAMGVHYNDENGMVIANYSHCKDLSSKSSSDSEDMTKAKDTIFELVKKWIS